jgi:hypothetical protein
MNLPPKKRGGGNWNPFRSCHGRSFHSRLIVFFVNYILVRLGMYVLECISQNDIQMLLHKRTVLFMSSAESKIYGPGELVSTMY